MEINFSIVIPTWNRKERLIELIKKIISINKDYQNFEILICDSNSTDGTEKEVIKLIEQNKDVKIKLLQAKHNNVSQKRNIGINNSFFNYIILIDDDCIPEDNFFNKYSQICKYYMGKKFIYSGLYKTDEYKIKYSNYYKYRDSRNYKSKNTKITNIERINFWSIVTGNLCFEKNLILNKNILFNEEITGYGFEDVDWGHRINDQNIEIIKVDVSVLHNETSSNIVNYQLKWYYQALTGMPLLIRENINAAKKLPLFFLENQSKRNLTQQIIYIFINYFMNKPVAKLLEYFLYYTDTKKIFFFPLLFKIILIYYYNRGIKKRSSNLIRQEDTKKNWFKKGYK